MLKIAKITDYAIVILSLLAKNYRGPTTDHMIYGIQCLLSANAIAKQTNIPLPMVAKILKILAKHELLLSVRGANGGYRLLADPTQISITQIIELFEGPMAITECSLQQHQCSIYHKCNITSHFRQINQIIYTTLNKFKLSQLTNQAFG